MSKDKRTGFLGEPGGCNHTLNLGCLMILILIVVIWLKGGCA
jgi:hypothetical protein